MYQGKVKNESEGSRVQTMPKMCSFHSSSPIFFYSSAHKDSEGAELHVLVNVRVCIYERVFCEVSVGAPDWSVSNVQVVT